MGCGGSALGKEETLLPEVNIPLEEEGYPSPVPATKRKHDIFELKSFEKIDERALSASSELSNNYDELIDYLIEGAINDLQKLRAVFRWMAAQEIKNMLFDGVTDVNTPIGYMRLISQNKGNYPAFLALLCRKAKLPCVIIHGQGKTASYEVGERDMTRPTVWNAVYVDGSWRIVHPRWACSGVVGYSTGTWTLVESRGQAIKKKQLASKGNYVYIVQEDYFIPDPERFVMKCFPNDQQWQLLEKPLEREEYELTLYLFPLFHELSLSLKKAKRCILFTDQGETSFELVVPSKVANKIQIYYELYRLNEQGEEEEAPIPKDIQFDRYVFKTRKSTDTIFEIRFPFTGTYKITVHGKHEDAEHERNLVFFRIECDVAKVDCLPLPDCPNIGWGPGFEAEKIGIEALSHTNGRINVVDNKDLNLKFKISKDIEMKTELMHNDMTREALEECTKQTINGQNADVTVKLPEEGEYALKVFAKSKDSSEEFQNVCNYLVNKTDPEKLKRETEDQKKLRENMKTAARGEDFDQLDNLINEFRNQKLEDKGDLQVALERLQFLRLQKNLATAIDKRDIKLLDKAINDIKKSKYFMRLRDLLPPAEELLVRWKRLEKAKIEILQMNQSTVAEIRSYKRPQGIIHDIMKSVYYLLGERGKKLDDWTCIQNLIGKLGRESLKRQISEFDIKTVPHDAAQRVEDMLRKYRLEDCKIASAGAATFYVWSTDVIQDIKISKEEEAKKKLAEEKEKTESSA